MSFYIILHFAKLINTNTVSESETQNTDQKYLFYVTMEIISMNTLRPTKENRITRKHWAEVVSKPKNSSNIIKYSVNKKKYFGCPAN